MKSGAGSVLYEWITAIVDSSTVLSVPILVSAIVRWLVSDAITEENIYWIGIAFLASGGASLGLRVKWERMRVTFTRLAERVRGSAS